MYAGEGREQAVRFGKGWEARPYVFVTFTPAETEQARVVSYEGDSCAGTAVSFVCASSKAAAEVGMGWDWRRVSAYLWMDSMAASRNNTFRSWVRSVLQNQDESKRSVTSCLRLWVLGIGIAGVVGSMSLS